ncbi:hypothetical protein ACHAXS_002515 [Conticribra weissflogii]
MSTESKRAPILLEGYSLGDQGKPEHFNANMSREEAKSAAGVLRVGDAAFIKRSDLKWTYAIVTDRKEDGPLVTLRFDVDQEKNRKSFPENQWGKYIRVINGTAAAANAQEGEGKENEVPSTPKPSGDSTPSVEVKATPKVSNVTPSADDKAPSVAMSEEKSIETPVAKDPAAPKVEAAPTAAPEATKPSAPAQKPPTAPAAKPPAQKSSGGWFSSLFGSSTPAPAPVRSPSPAPPARSPSPVPPASAPSSATDVAPTEPASTTKITTTSAAVVAAVAGIPNALKSPSEKPAETVIPDVTVNHSTVSDLTEHKAVDEKMFITPITPKKTPSSILKSFKFSKHRSNSNANGTPSKTTVATPIKDSSSPPKSTNATDEETKKVEWFDPQALECDYDKNPTDLFQALEARQFSYAHEMHKDSNAKFAKDCRTWVIARGKSDEKMLRFRALPLHAAIVFGAEDDLIKKIMMAYPKAARGRDVKGRLPIHLAYEKDVSDEIIDLLVKEFPKGFIAKDKKNMTPVDHIKEESPRAFLKTLLPKAYAAKIEEEREKWEVEMTKRLEEQKAQLKNDEQYLEDVVQHVNDELEAHHESVLQRTKEKHELAILDLKKKHAAEMKSLLEGFEVKLEFEKKLNKMKGK